jgi:predicted DNA-binding transcriptional regulator AlpA
MMRDGAIQMQRTRNATYFEQPTSQYRILRKRDVEALAGLSYSQIYRLERRGAFPARVKLSPQRVGWREQEVADWCNNRPRGGGTQPPLPKSRLQPPPYAANGAGSPIDNVLERSIDGLDLSVRASNALRSDNIILVGDLVERTKKNLMEIPNFGPVSLLEVESALAKLKLHLGMQLPDWDRSRHLATASAAE